MVKAQRTTELATMPYQLNLSEREMKWLARLAEIAYEQSEPASEDEEAFNLWVMQLQETFRQLDKNKG